MTDPLFRSSSQFCAQLYGFHVVVGRLGLYREKSDTVTRYTKGLEFYCMQSSEEKLLLLGTLTAVTVRLCIESSVTGGVNIVPCLLAIFERRLTIFAAGLNCECYSVCLCQGALWERLREILGYITLHGAQVLSQT